LEQAKKEQAEYDAIQKAVAADLRKKYEEILQSNAVLSDMRAQDVKE
jgi:hypothetical protein